MGSASNGTNDLRAEYDLSQLKGGMRGKYYGRATAGTNVLRLSNGADASDRSWYKYDFKVGSKIRYSGITKNLERREQQHQQRWPGGHIVQVGRATTENAAREWEKTKEKDITSKGK